MYLLPWWACRGRLHTASRCICHHIMAMRGAANSRITHTALTPKCKHHNWFSCRYSINMPQHDLEKGGKLPQHQQGRSSATAGESAEPSQAAGWQRGQGGFSGKAKKEYLKWKRQQKEAAAGPDSQGTDSDAVPSQPAGRREAGKQAAAPDSSADDPTLPLQYRPLVTVPAAPFIAAAAGPAASPAATAHGGSTAGSPASCSTIECVQLQDTRTGQHAAAAVEPASEPELVYMPRLDPSEVGFTAEGFELDMPVRPAWQVRTCDSCGLASSLIQALQHSRLAMPCCRNGCLAPHNAPFQICMSLSFPVTLHMCASFYLQ